MTRTCTPPREGHHSPWGPIETAEDVAEGIVSVHTASHGGIWLSPDRLALMDHSERTRDAWYEEDCEAAFPLQRFRDEVTHHYPADALNRLIALIMAYSQGRFAKVTMNRGA